MKFWKLAAFCMIGVFPTLGRADDPSTQPTNPPAATEYRPWDRPDRPRGGFEMNSRYFRLGGYGLRGRQDLAPTTSEWEDISAFMKEHSPERFKALSNLPEGRARTSLVALATRNYRNLLRMRNEQPDVAQLMMDRVELEDQIFKLANQLKSAKNQADRQSDTDKKLLQQKIGELLDMNIKERQLRISKLEKTLQNEQTQLAEDSKNRDELIERRLHVFLDGRLDGSPQDNRDQKPTTQP
jgi:hypothetical protein